MSTRYRLPEQLGGTELDEYRRTDGSTEAPTGTVAFLVDGCIVAVARALLVEVKPPRTPEPPLCAVVVDKHERAWQHVNDGRGDWECTVGDLGADWDELQEHAPLTRLVPDPAAGVELPWVLDVGPESRTDVAIKRVGYVHDVNRATGNYAVGVNMSPKQARDKAAALLAAADFAEVSDAP